LRILKGILHGPEDAEAYDDVGGAVYELYFPDFESGWQCTKITDLPGCPEVYDYDPDTGIIYVATTTSLLSVSVKERTCTKLADLSLYRRPNSVVRWNGKIYTGMLTGLVEYDPAAGDTKWYPLPYEKLIPKDKWNPRYDEEEAAWYEFLYKEYPKIAKEHASQESESGENE